jgi:hypothetical protein
MVLSLVDNIDIKKSIRKHKSRRGGMVDTTDSKSVARKGVRVQVSLPAFFHIKTKYPNRLHFFLYRIASSKSASIIVSLSCISAMVRESFSTL